MKTKTYLRIKIAALLLILIAVISFACDSNEGFMGTHNTVNYDGLVKDHKVIVIDSCEYIVYDVSQGYSGFGFMAHKGNCKYCAERRKKELESLR